jgi:hypothetical protein
VACGGDTKKDEPDTTTEAQYQAYFAQLTPVVNTLVQTIPKLDTSGNAPSAEMATTLRAYDDALNAFAAALDKIDAPGQATAAHENFSKQSKAIAKAFDAVQQRLSSPSHTPTSDELTLSLSTSGTVVQWVAACVRLQDLARTKGTPGADFKCATTLSLGGTGGT